METQNKQIQQHLESGRTITPLDALNLYGCLRLSARIFELRSKGLPVSMRLVCTERNKHVAQYYISHDA